MQINKQKFLIIGGSKSGYAVAKYLLDRKACFKVYEELNTQKAQKAIAKLLELGVQNISSVEAEEFLKEIDVLIVSPGVPINHQLCVKAKQLKKRIMGELEFAYATFMPLTVAITGTNGKTTTSTMVKSILDCAMLESQLVGNVGLPMTEVIDQTSSQCVYVTEVSSFQLESVNWFCPHISCILNITPDHLERHYNMENYIFLKKRIFKNQTESEYTVLNYDDQTVKNLYLESKAKIIFVSTNEKVNGGYLNDGKLYYFDEFIMNESQLSLSNKHNIFNALCAICICKILGVSNQDIVSGLQNFKGIKHRVQFVCEKNGVSYFNDSKATNTSSTISALSDMNKPTILILGGSEKGEEYDQLFEKIKTFGIKHTILTGASRYNMLECASRKNLTDLTVTKSLDYAVKIASIIAQSGDVVLFSPACASFDSFNNFEERGEQFIKLVEDL